MMRFNLLFIQLPQLDNDVEGNHENLRLAGVYLRYALERSTEKRYFNPMFLPEAAYDLDDAHLVQSILRIRPAVIACSLYVWNIERSLRILGQVRRSLPQARVLAGGPEVARDHPFLFKSRIPDVAVAGEGEAVFPVILRALRQRRQTHFSTVAWRNANGYQWGTHCPPRRSLHHSLPTPDYPDYRPDANGMAYLESSRGCPMQCVYCRYHHQRRGVSFLSSDETMRRVKTFYRKGAVEIRFIDPTFNAHPEFSKILKKLSVFNASRRIRFFAELKADLLTREQVHLLASANFTEIEVGVQSRDVRVLRLIKRPTSLDALDQGIRWMLAEGIRVTVDIMVGLPGQGVEDIQDSVNWAIRLKGANVQCLQTLLLAGTDLQTYRRRWELAASNRPPYGVTASSTLSVQDMRKALVYIHERIGCFTDCPTRSFIGHELPDLFHERVHMQIPGHNIIQGVRSRRALMLHGADLFAHRNDLIRLIRVAVRQEPHILWQFVLAPEWEEPLDLFDVLVKELKCFSSHLNDRWIALDFDGRRTARRILVLLGHRRYESSWVNTVDTLLRQSFY